MTNHFAPGNFGTLFSSFSDASAAVLRPDLKSARASMASIYWATPTSTGMYNILEQKALFLKLKLKDKDYSVGGVNLTLKLIYTHCTVELASEKHG